VTEPAASPGRRRTGPARSLTRAQVVDAALEVMAQHGLESVSFRTVSMRLGVDGKALYTYVSGKDDLLAAMFDRAIEQLDVPAADDPRPAADWLVDLLVSYRRLLMANPDLFRLNRPLGAPGVDADAGERVAARIYQLDPEDPTAAARLFALLYHYTIGNALYFAPHRGSVETQPETVAEANLDSDRHSHAIQLAEEEVFVDDEAGFARTIRIMLEQRAGEPPR
jgi:TetR/AcrR family transcriptional regulator, tetracycline repressor protein